MCLCVAELRDDPEGERDETILIVFFLTCGKEGIRQGEKQGMSNTKLEKLLLKD